MGTSGKGHLRVRVSRREDWAQLREPGIKEGGLFCPTTDPPDSGTEVWVEIGFVSGPQFLLRGTVVWRRLPGSDRRVKPGAGVRLHDRFRSTVEYINAWVAGTLPERRRHRRLPFRLRVTYKAHGQRRVNFTRDLCEAGVFVYSQQVLALDDQIELRLVAPDGATLPLRGRVVRRVEGLDCQGMGVALDFEDAASQERFVALIQELEQKYRAGELSDEIFSLA